jgi:hypothetical protein
MSNPHIRLVEELCPRNPEKLTEIIIGANNSVSTQKSNKYIHTIYCYIANLILLFYL